jgi:5-methylcytosine-specific restriction endonuclease McrA
MSELSGPEQETLMARRHSKPVRYYSPKRRAIYAEGDQINHLVLFMMHGWICWLCREPIDPKVRKPSIWAATVDHIVPLSKGGTHTWDNVAPAHAVCNFSKGDSLNSPMADTIVA